MATLTKYPTANTPTTGFNGVANSPTDAYTDNTVYANFAPSKPRNDEDAHSWRGFDFSAIPAGSTINSVTVKVQEYMSASNSVGQWRVALFEDVTSAGALAPGVTTAIGGVQYTRATTDTSEFEWDLGTLSTEPTLAQLQATNFGVRIEVAHGNTATSYTYYIDTIEITVDYTAPVAAPDFDLTGFRFRDDSAALNTDTWTYALNTDPTVDVYSGDVTLRLRVLLENTDTVTAMPSTGDYQLQYNVNGGTWYAIGAGTGIDTGVSSNFATGDATTQLLGSGSFATGEAVEGGSDATDRACAASTEIEHEWVFDLASAELSNNDLIDFRVVWRETTEAWNVISTPTHTPEITVTKVAPTVTQRWFCFYDDSVENAGDTARHGGVNRGKALADDTVYLLRMGMSASGSISVTPKLQYRVRTEAALGWSSWVDVNATSSYVRSAATANIADDAQTTEQLDDSGTFTAGRFDEVDGAITTATSLTATTDTEFLFAIKARSAELSWRNIVQLRMVNASDGAAYGQYDLYPTLSLAGSIAEDFEDGTDLANIQALNDTTPNTNFDGVSLGEGFTFTDTVTPPHGSLAAYGTSDPTLSGNAEWADVLCPELFARMYVYKSATPTANTAIARFYDSGDTARNAIRWLPDGTLNIQENDSTNHSAGSPSTAQWVRIEARWVAAASADGSDSILELKYWDTDADSTGTPDGTVTVDPAAGMAELGKWWLRFEGTEDWYFDEVSIANDDWIGPSSSAGVYDESGRVAPIDFATASSDTQVFVESLAALLEVTGASSDVTDMPETLLADVALATAVSDVIAATFNESLAALFDVATAVTDVAEMSESLSAEVVYAAAVGDALYEVWVEALSAALDLSTASSDVAEFVESVAAAVDFASAVVDELGRVWVENLDAAVDLATTLSDVQEFSDSLAADVEFTSASTDAQEMVDSLVALVEFVTDIVDTLVPGGGETWTENLAALFDLATALSDVADLPEALSADVALAAASSDVADMTEALSADVDLSAASSDVAEMSESLGADVDLSSAVADALFQVWVEALGADLSLATVGTELHDMLDSLVSDVSFGTTGYDWIDDGSPPPAGGVRGVDVRIRRRPRPDRRSQE